MEDVIMDDNTSTGTLAAPILTERRIRYATFQKHGRVSQPLISATSANSKADWCSGFEVIL